MTFHPAQLALVLLTLSVSASTQPSQCPALAHIDGNRGSDLECRCGNGLKNVTLTPPKGLRLVAACDLRKWSEGKGVFVNISAQRAVNLDRYDQDGNTSIGRYYFQGHLRMGGLLRFEPSDGGDLFFIPAQPVQMPQSTIEPYFRSIHLIPKEQDSTFNVTKSIRSMGCAEASVEVVAHDMTVVANDSEEAGAYPRRVEILRISPYKPCTQK